MSTEYSPLVWIARILALGMCAFLALFALDGWSTDKPMWQAAADVLIHLLPSALLFAVIVVSWRRQWIGGVAFVALAVAYAAMVSFRLDWVVVISGPMFIIGLLFLWSWHAAFTPRGAR